MRRNQPLAPCTRVRFERLEPRLLLDGGPPTVVSVELNDDGSRRSQADAITFTFDEDVTVTADALALYDDSAGAPVSVPADIRLHYDPVARAARWDLRELALPLGCYTATVLAARVTDAEGHSLDGDRDGIGGDDFHHRFLVALGGDTDLDGDVSFSDYITTKGHFGTAGGATWSDGDSDGSGGVDFRDYVTTKGNFGRSLSAASLDLTGPTGGTWFVGETVTVTWTAKNVPPRGKIVLCFDADARWNGNETWIDTGNIPAAEGGGTYDWDTSAAPPGTYCLGGYLLNPSSAWTRSHLTAPITLADPFQLDGTRLTVHGTGGGDAFTFAVGETYELGLNALSRSYEASAIDEIQFLAGGGEDVAALTGGAGSEVASLAPGAAAIDGPDYDLSATGVESVSFDGGGGDDTAILTGSMHGDDVWLRPGTATVMGGDYQLSVINVKAISVDGGDGPDVANVIAGAYSDDVWLYPGTATVIGLIAPPGGAEAPPPQAEYQLTVANVEAIAVDGAAGQDTAHLYDSDGDDEFVAGPGGACLSGDGFSNSAVGFETVHGYSQENGTDVALLHDSDANDILLGEPSYSSLTGGGFEWTAAGFAEVHAYADNNGNDTAELRGSEGSEAFDATSVQSVLSGEDFLIRAKFFDTVRAVAGGGTDTAQFTDSPGHDTFEARPAEARMYGDGFDVRAESFGTVRAVATDLGIDLAKLYDSDANDVLTASPTECVLSGAGTVIRVQLFEQVHAYATGTGHDRAELHDSDGDDTLDYSPTEARLSGDGYLIRVKFFEDVQAYAGIGTDVARLTDSEGDDFFIGRPGYSIFGAAGLHCRVNAFEVVTVTGSLGHDEANLRDSEGNDVLTAAGTAVSLDYASPAHVIQIDLFDYVKATSESGGTDRAEVGEIDFDLDLLPEGAWV